MSDYPVEQIPTEKVTWREQERKYFGPEELAEMAATIRVHGILHPIIVFRDGDGFVGLVGQRRWMSARLAGKDKVLAVVRSKPPTEIEAKEIRLIENNSREPLRPLEQSVGLDQYVKASGLSASEAAKRVGMKPAAASKALSLLKLDESIRQQIDAGLISPASGYVLAREDDPKLRSELAAQVAAGTLTRDALAGKIKARKRSAASATETKKSRITAKLSGARQVTVSADNLTVDSLITTLMELVARCRAARSKGHALGTMLKAMADESTRP